MKKSLFALMAVIVIASCKKDDPTPVVVNTTYSKMFIKSIDISTFPVKTANGGDWDVLSAPDIYLKISDSTGKNFFTSSVTQDATGKITVNPNYTITDFTYQYTFELWDKDSPDDDDAMGGYYFKANDYVSTNNYPASIVLSSPGKSDILLTLNVTYSN